jgi:hypothetical protein
MQRRCARRVVYPLSGFEHPYGNSSLRKRKRCYNADRPGAGDNDRLH